MSNRKKAIIGTGIVVGAAILILLFASFKTPLPLPAEEGMLINFGDVEYAEGPAEPKKEEKKIEQVKPVEPTPVKEVEEAVATQDFEEAPAIAPEPKKTPKKTEPKKEIPKKVEEKKVVEQPKTVNKKALYKGKKVDATYKGSEGNSSGTGNMGSKTGSENTNNRQQGLSSGDGVSFSLAGRNPVSLRKPVTNHQEEGIVVVEIKVDRLGRVTEARPGVQGSTTTNSTLLAEAKKAALASKFSSSKTAAFYQKGTITYYFKLQ